MKTIKRICSVVVPALTLLSCCMLTSCMEAKYNPGMVEEWENKFFDFVTEKEISVDIDYGTASAGALLALYVDNPINFNEEGEMIPVGEPIHKFFADEYGRLRTRILVPGYTDHLFIYSPTYGAPQLTAAAVTDNALTYKSEPTQPATKAITRAVKNLRVKTVSAGKGFYAVVDWAEKGFGAIEDMNGIVSAGGISEHLIRDVQHTLWNGRESKPSQLDNSKYCVDTEHINTTIAEAYRNDRQEVVTVDAVDVWFTFMNESTWRQDIVGYYFYKTGQAPASPASLKKYIIIPNASVAANYPFGAGGPYPASQAPMSANRKIQLLYVDERTGEVSPHFPAGYTIGYFVISNGCTIDEERIKKPNNSHNGSHGGNKKYWEWINSGILSPDGSYVSVFKPYLDANQSIYYSNKEWNVGRRSQFIALEQNGTVVYGVEDSESDRSYEDVLFTVTCSIPEAVQDPDLPPVDPSEGSYTTVKSTYTYAFEDLWSWGGDYDMNDVIVEHTAVITINGDNNVLKVVDTFVPVQKEEAMTRVNAFVVRYASSQRGAITLPAGSLDETETNSVILTDHVKRDRNKPFVVTREFADGAMPYASLNADLDPYIITLYDEASKKDRTEIHLPKYPATQYANPRQLFSGQEAFYIDKDGKHPFAIKLPILNFIPSIETVSISKEYPQFDNWVKTEGKEDADWYLHYHGN